MHIEYVKEVKSIWDGYFSSYGKCTFEKFVKICDELTQEKCIKEFAVKLQKGARRNESYFHIKDTDGVANSIEFPDFVRIFSFTQPREDTRSILTITSLQYWLPFLSAASVKLPFIFIFFERIERGGTFLDLSLLLGTYQCARLLIDRMQISWGFTTPLLGQKYHGFNFLHYLCSLCGILGYVMTITRGEKQIVNDLYWLCLIGLSENINGIKEAVLIETRFDSCGVKANNALLTRRLHAQKIAQTAGDAVTYLIGGILYEQRGLKATCYFGLVMTCLIVLFSMRYSRITAVDEKQDEQVQQTKGYHTLVSQICAAHQLALAVQEQGPSMRAVSEIRTQVNTFL